MRQALTLLDAVFRKCSLDLGLERSEVTVLALLAQQERRSVSDMAFFCGNHRQQVQRTVRQMAAKGLMTPAVTSGTRVERWTLSKKGAAVLNTLSLRLTAYESLMREWVNLDEVLFQLQRMVEGSVNRPSAMGWRRGLCVPRAAWMDLEWNVREEPVDEEVKDCS